MSGRARALRWAIPLAVVPVLVPETYFIDRKGRVRFMRGRLWMIR